MANQDKIHFDESLRPKNPKQIDFETKYFFTFFAKLRQNRVLYISTSIWVLRTPNAVTPPQKTMTPTKLGARALHEH